jgi:hypothetical protein
LAHSGTATAGAAGTLTDTNVLIHQTNDDLKDHELYIHTGTASGDLRRVSGSTAASSLVSVSPNFSATPDTTSQYLLFQPSPTFVTNLLLDGLDDALRRIRKRFLLSKTNEEYVVQDLLWGYGSMQRWTNGASSAPDGWALSSNGSESVARSTLTPNRFAYSAAVTSDGTNAASLSRSIAQYGEYHDLSVSLYGWLRCNTASRATLRVTDGVTTNDSDALTTVDTWYEVGPGKDIDLDVLEIDGNPTELTVSLQISSGAQATAYVADLRLILAGRALDIYELPATNGYGAELTAFQWLQKVQYEDSIGSWNYPASNHFPNEYLRSINREGTRFLHIARRDLTALAGRRMLMVGQEGPPRFTANTSSTTVDAAYMGAYAAWYALRGLPLNSERERRMQSLELEWRERDRLIRARPLGGSIPIEAD